MLKLFYICYFITSGVGVPFFSPYLHSLGLSGKQVSAMLSLAPFLQLGVPLGWGWLADRTQRPDRVLRFLCLAGFLCSLPMVFVRTMPAIFAIYFVQQIFTVAIMGLADSLAVDEAQRGGDYAQIRLWGSASFVGICALVGPILTARGARTGDMVVPALMSVGYGLSFLASLRLRGHRLKERPHARDIGLLLADRRFVLLLVLAGIHWACLSPYHGFFGILLRDRGFSLTLVSYAFNVAVVAEIAAFLFFARLRRRVALMPMLALCFSVTAVRWWLVAHLTSAAWMVGVQATHALSFGVFWATCMAWVGACVPPRIRATGQVLFTAVTFGLGNIIGFLASGALYDAAHGASTAFSIAAAIEVVPLVLALTLGRGVRVAPQAAAEPASIL